MSDIEKTVVPSTHSALSDKNEVGQVAAVSEYTNEVHNSGNYLHRNFKARHVQMITLAGCIGSGVFISTGEASHHALQYGGAVGMLIAYPLICSMALMMLTVLSEANCLFPTSGSFIDHAGRFVDPALGFAIGFTEWFGAITVIAAEAAVFPVVISYWTTSVSSGGMMTVYLVVVFAFHVMPNKWFAEFEFVTGAAKILLMVIVILVMIAICAGAGNGDEYIGQNYNTLELFPYGFKGVARCFLLASWATGGQEIMGVVAGEAKMPRWDLPRARVNLFFRILLIYLASSIFIGVLVPYTEPLLLNSSDLASSPFVIAMGYAGIKVLPDIVNVVLLICLVGIGSEEFYVASRIQTALAKMGMMPALFARVDSAGRPIWSLLCCGTLGTIMTYMCLNTTGAIAFNWFSSISATTTFFAWMIIPLTNWCMHRALKAQNDPAFSLPYAYKTRFWPFESIYLFTATLFCFVCTIWVSASPVDGTAGADIFFETMLCLPVFIVAYFGWKIWFRTSFVKPSEADLISGRRYLTEEDIKFFDAYYSQPLWRRVISYVRFG
ncbi:AAT family amino acid transporter-3 [Coleophoma crateriformis]|uniref:AAT family amino acid transporter-3 n=1 Tax=Coleophoma crateriformis TaxID=565419 RepID=A0A3D8Q8N1_9HELO|nr:AAT family amino acid transporter-3 [Coleophoma crateriformis]